MYRLNCYLTLIESEEEQNKFEIIYEHYKGKMKHKAVLMLCDAYKAEEALQQMFLYVAKNLHKIDVPISIETQRLLYVVTAHCAYDVIKRNRNWDMHHVAIDEALQLRTEDLNLSLKAESDVIQALNRLKENKKTVILLRYGMNYTVAEIAELLALSVYNVEKLLSRGKTDLRRFLQEVRSDEV